MARMDAVFEKSLRPLRPKRRPQIDHLHTLALPDLYVRKAHLHAVKKRHDRWSQYSRLIALCAWWKSSFVSQVLVRYWQARLQLATVNIPAAERAPRGMPPRTSRSAPWCDTAVE